MHLKDVTGDINFYQGHKPHDLTAAYGTPLYVYNERIFRRSCGAMRDMCPYPLFQVNYSIKANCNLTLLGIAKAEGLHADATSAGEVAVALAGGFSPDQVFFIPNNVSADEMMYAIERGVLISVDSPSQLATFGRINPGGRVALRFNPGIGGGHHEKVITGGKSTKFGINEEYIPDVKAIVKQYNLRVVGVNQHIGSSLMQGELFMVSLQRLLSIAKHFDDLEFIDLGGGFGIPYGKQTGEKPLDLQALGQSLAQYIEHFSQEYGKKLMFKVEPGRYIPAECGVLLGTAHAIKYNGATKYIGTDMGFTVLARPMLYDAFHGIEVYHADGRPAGDCAETVDVVGNICESGDYIAKDRNLPLIEEGDVLGVLDAGAYGYAMSSQYNNRLRPAEILIREDSTITLVRRRDTYDDLLTNMRGC